VRLGSSLRRKLGFDTVDIVDIILEVERHFQITIPDEVPLAHVQDFVGYVATQAPALRPPAENDSWTRAARGGYLPSYQSSS
jgi:acyl carrier protein